METEWEWGWGWNSNRNRKESANLQLWLWSFKCHKFMKWMFLTVTKTVVHVENVQRAEGFLNPECIFWFWFSFIFLSHQLLQYSCKCSFCVPSSVTFGSVSIFTSDMYTQWASDHVYTWTLTHTFSNSMFNAFSLQFQIENKVNRICRTEHQEGKRTRNKHMVMF